jgi:hypothetical protein
MQGGILNTDDTDWLVLNEEHHWPVQFFQNPGVQPWPFWHSTVAWHWPVAVTGLPLLS